MTDSIGRRHRSLTAALVFFCAACPLILIPRLIPLTSSTIDPVGVASSADVHDDPVPDLNAPVVRITPTTPASLTVLGARSHSISELELLRFADRAQRGTTPQPPQESLVLREVVRLRVDGDEQPFDLANFTPSGEHWVLRSALPLVSGGAGAQVLAPVYLGRVSAAPIQPETVVCDLNLLAGISVDVADISVGDSLLDIDVWPPSSGSLAPPESCAFRFSCAAAKPPRVLGPAGTFISVSAREGPFAFPVKLTATRNSPPLEIPRQGTSNVAVTATPIGPLVVYRGSVPLDVPCQIGLSPSEVRVAPPLLRHGLVSLPRLAESGYSRILLQPAGQAMQSVSIASLKHDEFGTVQVDLSLEKPSWIDVVVQGDWPAAEWQVFARPATRSVEGVTAELMEGRCVLGPIEPGRWQIYWRRAAPPTFLPLADVLIPPGVRHQILCPFRTPTRVTVRFFDWNETPPDDRPVAVRLGASPCKATAGQPGCFQTDLVLEDRFAAELSLLFAGIGGELTLKAEHWHGTELLAFLPKQEVVDVTVLPRHGGTVELWNYFEGTAPDAPQFPLKRKLRATAIGSHHFRIGRSHAIGASELLPDGTRVFLGFFACKGDALASNPELPGRWVGIVGDLESEVIMTARLLGMDVDWHQEMPILTRRFWLPNSVDVVEVRTRDGLRRFSNTEIGAAMIL